MFILKSKLSGCYLKNIGVWTSDPLDAFTFADEWTARDYTRREQVDDVQVFEAKVHTPELSLP